MDTVVHAHPPINLIYFYRFWRVLPCQLEGDTLNPQSAHNNASIAEAESVLRRLRLVVASLEAMQAVRSFGNKNTPPYQLLEEANQLVEGFEHFKANSTSTNAPFDFAERFVVLEVKAMAYCLDNVTEFA